MAITRIDKTWKVMWWHGMTCHDMKWYAELNFVMVTERKKRNKDRSIWCMAWGSSFGRVDVEYMKGQIRCHTSELPRLSFWVQHCPLLSHEHRQDFDRGDRHRHTDEGCWVQSLIRSSSSPSSSSASKLFPPRLEQSLWQEGLEFVGLFGYLLGQNTVPNMQLLSRKPANWLFYLQQTSLVKILSTRKTMRAQARMSLQYLVGVRKWKLRCIF